jgi:transcription antitermination factor NusG
MDAVKEFVHAADQWYVIHCKRLREWRAAAALEERLGLATYLPEIQRRHRGQMQRFPFFPGYLFVWANLREVVLSHINAMPGVLRLVAIGELPQPVPMRVIEEIRQRVDDLNAHGGLIPHNFRPGDTLKLKDSPLQGLEAIFLGPMKPSERVRVLIDFLGHYREAEVDVDMLEHISTELTPKLERRTRGKGRRIKVNRGT